MMGKMTLGLMGLLGKGLSGGGAKGLTSALSTAGSAGGGKGRHGGGKRRGSDSSLLEDTVRSLLKDSRRGKEKDRILRLENETSVPAIRQTAEKTENNALDALTRHIVSFTDGRVRLRHPAFRETAVHAPLRHALEACGCFTRVEFKSSTGSVLLCYPVGSLSRSEFLEAARPLGEFLILC